MLKRFVLIALSALCLAGCKTKYVAVPEYHTEYKVRTDSVITRDTIMLRDSVYVSQFLKGDTVYVSKVITKWRDKAAYRHIAHTDTIIKTDSIRVPMPVERSLTKSERRYIRLGRLAAGFLCMAVVGGMTAAVWWYRKKI